MRHTLATLIALAVASCAQNDPAGLSGKAQAAPPTGAASTAASAAAATPASAAGSAAPASGPAGAPASGPAGAPASGPASAPAAGQRRLAQVPAVAISQKLDNVDQATAEDLGRLIKAGELKRTDLRDPKNGPRFLHLAARSTDPALVAEALRGMRSTYTVGAGGARKLPVVNDDYRKVVRARLESDDDRVLLAAYDLTSKLLIGAKPDAPTLAVVLKHLADPAPSRRIRALDALVNVADFQLDMARSGSLKEQITTAVVGALETATEPAVLAHGLETLGRVGYDGMPQADRAVALARKHLAHAEPGVRGMALFVLGRVAKKADAEADAAVAKGLTDPEAVVRGSAVMGSKRLTAAARVEALMKLVDDNAVPQRDVGGFTGLDGLAGTVRVRAGGQRICIGALDGLDEALKPRGFKPPSLAGVSGTDALLAVRRDHVKAWVAKNPK